MDIFKKLQFTSQKKAFISGEYPAANMLRETCPVSVQQTWQKDTDIFIGFVLESREIEVAAKSISHLESSDPLIWFMYPKKSSKQYETSLNRDNSWNLLAAYDLEPVRQVSVDDDWSALRFRKVGAIKTMTRGFALTREGKAKVRTSQKQQK